MLNCGKHKCEKLCHAQPCEPCSELIHQTCYCGGESRDIDCTRETTIIVAPASGCDKEEVVVESIEFACGRPCGGRTLG